ncbi:MAG: hypothetical protein ABI972_13310 [Acidobacteriota bacterium]
MRSIVLGGLLIITTSGFAVSVEEAYRLIPHQRTEFQSTTARMAGHERAYLTAFFSAIDQAIVAKVESRRGVTVAEAYAPVWKAWASLSPPVSLRATQDKVKAAIVDQQTFLFEIERKQSAWNMSHARVLAASSRLRAAYGELMRIYPGEDATNKQAFFDYLCALDFI